MKEIFGLDTPLAANRPYIKEERQEEFNLEDTIERPGLFVIAAELGTMACVLAYDKLRSVLSNK